MPSNILSVNLFYCYIRINRPKGQKAARNHGTGNYMLDIYKRLM